MSAMLTGAVLGAVLAFAALIFGFWGFLLVAVLMGIGAVTGGALSGRVDLRAVTGALAGRRMSS